ncbi:MAG: TadE/TadG family type IV pilus assembly protein [Bryobacteraceae bacterium]|jgi:Flp pilus assembly protein TadG
MTRWAKRWLLWETPDLRFAPRYIQPDVVVHYWDGSAPEGRYLRDISQAGAYIYTPERWYPGTIVRIVLQGYRRAEREDGTTAPAATACVHARVVRHGPDGVGVEFAFRDKAESSTFKKFLAGLSVQPARTAPPPDRTPSRREGQALVEFAVIVPLVFLLAVNVVNFGGFIFAWITVAGAARAGAEYMVMSSASPGAPTPATMTQIRALVASDVASLPNKASIVVATCTNSATAANGCTTLHDPEAPTYTLATVDVTYTYKPLIPSFLFPGLGIAATLPSATVHRKAVMRMLQ